MAITENLEISENLKAEMFSLGSAIVTILMYISPVIYFIL